MPKEAKSEREGFEMIDVQARNNNWERCRIGSCHRHQACMYAPCRAKSDSQIATDQAASAFGSRWWLGLTTATARTPTVRHAESGLLSLAQSNAPTTSRRRASMSEIQTPLTKIKPGESFTAGEDGAVVITERNSHADIIRYVVSDIGEDAAYLVFAALGDTDEQPEIDRAPKASTHNGRG